MNKITSITQNPIVIRTVNIARIVFFLLGVITCFSTNKFFNGCNNPHSKSGNQPVLYDMQLEAKTIAAYNEKIIGLQNKNHELEEQVNVSKSALDRSRKNNAILEATLKDQVNRNFNLKDTAQIITNCDSIAQTAFDLLESSTLRDSLCQALTGELELQILNRDSTMNLQDQQYDNLKFSYDRILTQQQVLLSNNILLKKDVKRAKVKNRVLSAGLLILGGMTTSLLLRH